MNKKVLVVGGAGYIGGLTTDVLISRGYDVTVFDKLLYENHYLKNVPFIYGDIRNTKQVASIAKNYDEIIWLAALVGDGACAHDPELTTEINLNSIDRFLSATKRRIIFTSTCSVYGAQDGILNENSPTSPLSVYAATKVEAEKSVLKHGGLVFRLGTLFGLGDQHSRIRLDLVVNIMTLKAFRDGKLTVFGGDQWRPIIAVKDVAEYLAEATTVKVSDVFNVKFQNVKMSDLALQVKNIFPSVKIETTDMKFEDLRNYRVDTSKAEKVFSHKAKTTIESEIVRMRDMFGSGRIKDFNNDLYYNTNYVKFLLSNSYFSEK